jgi:acetyltransferase
MSQRGLEALLRPKSIAVIGASMKPNRAGYLMMRNLLAGGFNGPVLPVTPAWKAVLGVLAWPNINSLPFSPDLAVLCTNASRNLALLEALGEKGCKTCIILSAPRRSTQSCWPAHHATTYVCWAPTAWDFSRPGKA